MITGLWLIALAQGGAPLVVATVDRTRLNVGDPLVLTVRARTRSAQALTFALPSFAGFAIVATHEVTDVSLGARMGGAVLRTTLRQVTLRAERAGALIIGPVRVQQGATVVATQPISITAERSLM